MKPSSFPRKDPGEKQMMKEVRITKEALNVMRKNKQANSEYQIKMETINWSGPIFRLVQVKNIRDNDIPFSVEDVVVYLADDLLPYIDILTIVPNRFDDEVLDVVEDIL